MRKAEVARCGQKHKIHGLHWLAIFCAKAGLMKYRNFGTSSKQNPDPTVGCRELARLRPLTQKPLVAIGGIHLENVAQVFEAGADSVAIISGLLSDPNQIRQTTELWLKTLHHLPIRN